uniref:Cytochrome P450 family 8 subfamily B member 1 n=1 Tax=Anas platyrhynchos TaxID=8839 RepID=A0A8B9QY94_ANAPL
MGIKSTRLPSLARGHAPGQARGSHGALGSSPLCPWWHRCSGGLYLLGAFRSRRPNEPPLDKGVIPWLGYLLDFRKNSSEFLKKMRRKHGDIFTVLIGGHYFTFVMDPFSFGAIMKESRSKLDFRSFASKLVLQVFGYKPIQASQSTMHALSMKHLTGDGLSLLTKATMGNLQKLMFSKLSSGEEKRPWQEDNLFHYCYNIVFRAGYLASVRHGANERDLVNSNQLFNEFRKYDHLFPCLAYAMLPPKDKLEAERLKRFFWSTLSVRRSCQKDNVSGWITDQDQFLVENGVPEYMRDRFRFMLLWASQGNTGPTCLLAPPLPHEASRRHEGCEGRGREGLEGEQATSTVLRQGDRVALFPHLSVQMDPEIYPEPHKFKYDRFINPDGTKKDFYKDWETLVDGEEEIPAIDVSRWGFGTMQPIRDVRFRYRRRF